MCHEHSVDTGYEFYRSKQGNLTAGTNFDEEYEEHYLIGSAALTNASSVSTAIVYVGNDNGSFYARKASKVALGISFYYTGQGLIRSSPAIAYILDSQDNLDRWVYITTRANGGRLLAFKTDQS